MTSFTKSIYILHSENQNTLSSKKKLKKKKLHEKKKKIAREDKREDTRTMDEDNPNHPGSARGATRIDLTDIDDALGNAVAYPPVSDIVPSDEYMDDVMSITSQSRGGSVVADAPEDEEVR